MDPYKLLGVSERKIKHESDLQPVRKRAKTLYKRFCQEKKKFDAKKVLEAFDLIKKKVKGRLGEGANKILGRSRMERMMDKHYNRQTKEIKKDKRVRKELKKARKGEERFHLPGDKERIYTHKQLKHKRRRRRRDRHRRSSKQMNKKQVEVLQGLTRLSAVLSQQSKFPKAVKLVYRWMKEYMNKDNREFVFEVLQNMVEFEYLLDEPDARQDVITIFEYVLSYFAEWFDATDKPGALRAYWRLATVLASQCYTDDAFILTRTLNSLNEMLAFLEKHKDALGDGTRYEDDHKQEPKQPKAKRFKVEDIDVKEEGGVKNGIKEDGIVKDEMKMELKEAKEEEDDDESESAVEIPWPEATDSEVEAEVKKEPGDVVEPTVKAEAGDVEDIAVKTEALLGAKDEESDGDFEKFGKVNGKKQAKEEEDSDAELGVPFPLPSPGPLPSPSPGPIELGDSDDDAAAIDIDSEAESVAEEEISSGADSDVEVEELDSTDESSDLEFMGAEEGGVEELEDSVFPVPAVGESLYKLRAHFVNRCLATLFSQRGPLWARSKIDNFFQDLFYRREVFALEQRTQIEAWQSRIKTLQKVAERDVGTANNPLEAHRPVVDSREERVFMDADGGAWAAKQTFDAREASAGKVIR